MVSTKSGALKYAPLKLHMLMFANMHDQIPPDPEFHERHVPIHEKFQ
jgi:hypothetical protein